MRLSTNFTLAEFTKSQTATRKGLNNTPGEEHLANAKELFGQADVDGGLIGGASLKAEDFTAIISSF